MTSGTKTNVRINRSLLFMPCLPAPNASPVNRPLERFVLIRAPALFDLCSIDRIMRRKVIRPWSGNIEKHCIASPQRRSASMIGLARAIMSGSLIRPKGGGGAASRTPVWSMLSEIHAASKGSCLRAKSNAGLPTIRLPLRAPRRPVVRGQPACPSAGPMHHSEARQPDAPLPLPSASAQAARLPPLPAPSCRHAPGSPPA